jgi:hypothetical protein
MKTIDFKDYQVFNLQAEYSKNGVCKLYLLNAIDKNGDRGLLVAKAGGYGYDKLEACLNEFFRKIGYCTESFIHLGLCSSYLNRFLETNNLKLETQDLLNGIFLKLTRNN